MRIGGWQGGGAVEPPVIQGSSLGDFVKQSSKIMGYLGQPSKKLNAVRDEEVGLKC